MSQNAIDSIDQALNPQIAMPSAEDLEAQEYGGAGNTVLAGGAGVARGLTFGLSDQAMVQMGIDPETLSKLKKYNPGFSTAGEVVGIALPMVATLGASAPEQAALGAAAAGTDALITAGRVAKVAKGAGTLVEGAMEAGNAVRAAAEPIVSSLTGKVLSGSLKTIVDKAAIGGLGSAVEGSLFGVGQLVSEDALGEDKFNAENLFAHALNGAEYGLALGGVIEGGIQGIKEAYPLIKSGATKFGSKTLSQLTGVSEGDLKTYYAGIKDIEAAPSAEELGDKFLSMKNEAEDAYHAKKITLDEMKDKLREIEAKTSAKAKQAGWDLGDVKRQAAEDLKRAELEEKELLKNTGVNEEHVAMTQDAMNEVKTQVSEGSKDAYKTLTDFDSKNAGKAPEVFNYEDAIQQEIAEMRSEVELAEKTTGLVETEEYAAMPEARRPLNRPKERFQDNTYPDWYKNMKVDNKADFFNQIEKMKGPKYQRIKDLAEERLISKGTIGPKEAIKAGKEALIGHEGKVAYFDGYDGIIETKAGEKVMFHADNVMGDVKIGDSIKFDRTHYNADIDGAIVHPEGNVWKKGYKPEKLKTGIVSRDDVLSMMKREQDKLQAEGENGKKLFLSNEAKEQFDRLGGRIEELQKLPEDLNGVMCKQIIQGLDQDLDKFYQVGYGSWAQKSDIAMSNVRRYMDKLLKDAVPAYKSKMAEVAEKADLISRVSKRMPKGDASRIKGAFAQSMRPGSDEIANLFHELGDATGRDFRTPIAEMREGYDKLKNPLKFQEIMRSKPEYKAYQDAVKNNEFYKRPESALGSQMRRKMFAVENFEKKQAEGKLSEALQEFTKAQERRDALKFVSDSNPSASVEKAMRKHSTKIKDGLAILGKETNEDLLGALEKARLKSVFEKGNTNGSRNVNLWSILAGTGTFVATGGNVFAALATAGGGSWFGSFMDKYGPAVAKKLLNSLSSIDGALTAQKVYNAASRVVPSIEGEMQQASFPVLKAIEEGNKKTIQNITKAVGALFTAGKFESMKIMSVDKHLKSDSDHEKTLASYQNFKEQQEKIAERFQEVNKNLSFAAPNTSGAALGTMTGAITFLDSKLPRSINNSPFLKFSPPKTEVEKFNRYYHAVKNPMHVVSNIGNGSVTSEELEVMENVYPSIMGKIKEAATMKIKEGPIPYQKRLALNRMLGIDSDYTLRPESIVTLQQSNLEQQQEGSQNPRNVSTRGTGQLKISNKGMTDSQLAINRRELT